MTPEPSPALCCELASTDTVDGSTFAATACTEPEGAAARLSDTGALVLSWLSELSDDVAAPELSCAPAMPPPNPASRARAAVVTTMTEVRRPLVVVPAVAGAEGCNGGAAGMP